jgi:hypothetical protein
MNQNIFKLKEALDTLNKYAKITFFRKEILDNLQSCSYELEKVINNLEELKETKEVSL